MYEIVDLVVNLPKNITSHQSQTRMMCSFCEIFLQWKCESPWNTTILSKIIITDRTYSAFLKWFFEQNSKKSAKYNLVTILVQALQDRSRLGLAYSPSKLL